MSNRVDGGYKVCCDSYRGRLRTVKVFWWLHGLACCLVGLGHNCCCDAFRGRLKIEDHKNAVVATGIR